jgi:hypothetical protein
MRDNVYRFRTIKHGDPERKLQMIPDQPRTVSVAMGVLIIIGIVGGGLLASFALASL